ncbi:Galactose mutarotase-like domain-containing protein [Cynara cardunculus var. scolymus]|uniref:Galactose mutarotase-like domain-containing protein n=1 Tax=Cynara cardunculus var. scolymus TaxID=59895 RepID=A0A118K1X1_CYNCS|nr:Galactose mutarotase-like domain-containing protein [Cynara cardunculus var. scolymus]
MSTLKITKKHNKHLNNPFPSKPKTLPFKQGTLILNSQTTLSPHQIFPIGKDFQLVWRSANGGYASISHKSQPTRSIWSTIPGQAFISTAMAETEVEESRGSFIIKDRNVQLVCDHQTIEHIQVLKIQSDINLQEKDQDFASGYVEFDPEMQLRRFEFPILLITGRVFGMRKNKKVANGEKWESVEKDVYSYARYRLLFDQKNSNQIGFQVKLGKLNLGSSPKVSPRNYRGFVRKSSRPRRIRVRLWGSFLRRRQLVTDSCNEEENVAMKDGGYGCFNRICFTYSSEKNERFFGFGEQFSRGDWSTTYAPSPFYMTSKMKSLYLEGYDYSVFDLTQDDRVQIQIRGDCVEGRILYGSSPSELIEQFTESIGRPPELPDWIISGAIVGMQGGTNAVRRVWEELVAHDIPISAFWLQRNLFEEAKKLDILVRDKNGEAYMVPNTAFDVGMLDLTHPHAATWFKQILQEMVDDGVRGWMADFGEGLPVDACIYSGEDPISAHNRYPELWAQINREFMEEWKSTLVGKEKEDPSESLVFFMRAGFRNSPKWAMLFWEGDQMVSWQANDGIKSAVVGLLSSGLCGYAFNHSDIGGYCAVNLPFIKYRRDEELLLRWMELNAFTTIFRTHEGNKPSVNSQFYSNQRTLSHFARFAKVYKAWKFYRVQLVKEASQKGLPVCRHLFLHYPNDDHVHNLTYEQFLVGEEILVVPTLDKHRKNVKAYFPVGENCGWKHIWTGNIYNIQGSEASIEAPIGYPAIFVKNGSVVGETFLGNLREYKIL